MDEETRQAFAQIDRQFAELMARMNDQHERVLDRLNTLESEVRNLHSEHSSTREFVMALPGTMLRAIEQPLLQRITKIENRLDDLERKP